MSDPLSLTNEARPSVRLQRLIPVILVFFLSGFLIGNQVHSEPEWPVFQPNQALFPISKRWSKHLAAGYQYGLRLDPQGQTECVFPRRAFRVIHYPGQAMIALELPLTAEELAFAASIPASRLPPKTIGTADSLGSYRPCPPEGRVNYGS